MISRQRIRGCLLGGAMGDALGWPVEFLRLSGIKRRFGPDGITELVLNGAGVAEITDDTQMTLFTAEGLLRAKSRWQERGMCHPASVVYRAYLRWLHTQGVAVQGGEGDAWQSDILNGWLIRETRLFARRGPGSTCLSALSSGVMGTVEQPVNNSKGCGGVMRVAPVGLIGAVDPFGLGCECAAITHGHPSGYLAAGFLAAMIHALAGGAGIKEAALAAREILAGRDGSQETLSAVDRAMQLAEAGRPAADKVARLGRGWVAEEALAIALYSALSHPDDMKKALCLAVNHDGDSDSTGAITGNILGAYLGEDGLPAGWADQVELADVIRQIADDLAVGYRDDEEWAEKYPGY